MVDDDKVLEMEEMADMQDVAIDPLDFSDHQQCFIAAENLYEFYSMLVDVATAREKDPNAPIDIDELDDLARAAARSTAAVLMSLQEMVADDIDLMKGADDGGSSDED